jgi:hypothetical protein
LKPSVAEQSRPLAPASDGPSTGWESTEAAVDEIVNGEGYNAQGFPRFHQD